MDCKKLSPNALRIFEKIKEYYPPDPWKNLQWKEEGLVYANGWHDLRKAEDRDKLIKWQEYMIGSAIVIFAGGQKDKKGKFTRSAFNFKMSRKWIELAILLKDLDFQIETLDLMDM